MIELLFELINKIIFEGGIELVLFLIKEYVEEFYVLLEDEYFK